MEIFARISLFTSMVLSIGISSYAEIPAELAALKPLEALAQPVAPTRESMDQAYPDVPEWYRDAKFGIYTHWGIPAFGAKFQDQDFSGGWYGRSMYKPGYWFDYHRKHWGDQNEVGFKDLIPKWKTPDFDAGEWAELFAGSGAKFAGPVAIHHDNFMLWDSDWYRWCSGKMGPKRDFSGELAEAIRARGLKYMASFHHAQPPFHFWYAHQYDAKEPGAWDLYTKPGLLPRDKQQNTERAQTDPHHTMVWRNAVIEFVNKYEPDLIYFEGGQSLLAGKESVYMAIAHYFNKARASGREVVVTAKPSDYQYTSGFTVLDHERGREETISADPWQTDTCPGSWFWYGCYDRAQIASDDEMIDQFIDIVSKNGIMLLNIPPTDTGAIPERSKRLMKNFGSWLETNGEAIYGTRAWVSFGEGITEGVSKGFNTDANAEIVNSGYENGTEYDGRDIRYTRSKDGKTLYAIFLGWPGQGSHRLNIPKLEGRGRVELLGHGPVEHRVDDQGYLTLNLTEPPDALLDVAYAFKISGFTIGHQDDAAFHVPGANIHLPAVAAQSIDQHLSLEPGIDGKLCLKNWHHRWTTIQFLGKKFPNAGAHRFRLLLRNPDGSNTLVIRIEDQEIQKQIPNTKGNVVTIEMGTLDLSKAHELPRIEIARQGEQGNAAGLEIYALEMAPTLEGIVKPGVFPRQ